MKCKYCFSEIPNNATFCKYCGSVLNASANARVQQTAASKNGQVAAPVKKHTFRKFLLFLFVSFIVLSLIAYALILIFFPVKRYYMASYTLEMNGSKTEYTLNHRNFVTELKSNGDILFKANFDSDGKISEITYNIGHENTKINLFNYTSDDFGYTATAESDGYEIRIEYDKHNHLTDFSLCDQNGKSIALATMEYNAFGILVESDVTSKGERTFKQYDYKGDLIVEETYCNGTLIFSAEYERRVMTKSSTATEISTEDSVTSVAEYQQIEYDESGMVPTKCETFNASNEMIYYYETESKTDDLVVFVEKDGKTHEPVGYHRYALGSDGRVEQIKEEDTDGNLVQRTEYSYDRDGNLETKRIYDSDGNQTYKLEAAHKKIPLFLFD